MTKGGAGPYRKGAAFERATQDHYEKHGWLCVRQPKSQSPFDLIAVKKTIRHLVQCKLNGKIPKKEKEVLVKLCHLHQFSPVLAWKEDGAIRLKFLDFDEKDFVLDGYLI